MTTTMEPATWPHGGAVTDKLEAPCVLRNSSADYHRGDGLSRSELMRLLKTPYHFHELHLSEHDGGAALKEASDAMFAGELMHCALLERAEFERRYAVGPVVPSRASKEWKQFIAGLKPDVVPITALQHKIAHAQADALLAMDHVTALLDQSLVLPEHAGYWLDDATGALCKCRPDLAVLVGNDDETFGWVLVDAKTTINAAPESFAGSVVNFGYAEQAAWYVHGWGRATGLPVHAFLFGCVESAFPHAAALYQLPDEWVAYGWKRCRRALDVYADCLQRDEWPGYPPGVQMLQPPDWRWLRLAMGENA
jgi:hypothetical protein